MAIREDIVASAAQFLQDPSVASSSVENRISFLRTKNLTPEEIDAAMARAGGTVTPAYNAPYPSGPSAPPQQYYQPLGQHAWQPPPPTPKRDWRDWFIMATVVSGVSYGLYSLGKRYVYPLVAPPTPERLEQDKKSIEEQFDRAFTLVEQLAKDTETLKDAEKERTERLDTAISELEMVMGDLKTANRRREDDAQRIRDEVQALKDAIPKAMDNQKQLTDNRLREINGELTSLKTLVTQRMAPSTTTNTTPNSYLRNPSGTGGSSGTSIPTIKNVPALSIGRLGTAGLGSSERSTEAASANGSESPKTMPVTSFNRTTPNSHGAKASIPAWQMAMANQNTESSSTTAAEGGSSGQQEPGSSSSSS